MEGYSPSITDQPCRGPEESKGVRLVDQDVSADYEIKSFLGRKGFNRRRFKANLSQSGRMSPFCSQRENFQIAINFSVVPSTALLPLSQARRERIAGLPLLSADSFYGKPQRLPRRKTPSRRKAMNGRLAARASGSTKERESITTS
jgi:hypothetical protein